MAKKMTAKQKSERAKIKKKLQEEGIIPPNKKPLNREKFIKEADDEFAEAYGNDAYAMQFYLLEAVRVMTAHGTIKERHSLQAVGAAKAFKIAVRLKQFSDKLKAEGRTTYKISEKFDCIKDIMNL